MQHSPPPATLPGNKGVAPRNIVTGGVAAKRLGLARSTLTRYLTTYPELNRSTVAGKILVDLEELKTHRAENVNRVKSGNYAGTLFDETAPGDPADELDDDDDLPAARPSPAHGVRDEAAPSEGGKYANARARREEALARKAEREEALALEQLVIREEVDAALGDALVALRDKLLSPDLDLCELLARTDDPTKVLTILRKSMRSHLDKLAEAFADHDADAAGIEEPLPDTE